MTSILIHTGINIDSEGAPVKASGLTSEMGITDIEDFAKEVMTKYEQEIDDIILASTKLEVYNGRRFKKTFTYKL